MKILFKIVLLACLFNISAADAQIGLQLNQETILSNSSSDFEPSIFNYHFSFYITRIYSASDFNALVTQNENLQAFPKIYNYHNLAFFCKVEVELEKAAKFPVKFRLGDVNYVDQLEGK